MPWVIRDMVDDINKAVAKRWRHLDPLLPEPSDLPEGCMAPLLALGDNSRPSGLGVCRHQHVAADTLAQTWGTATKFVLSMRLRGPDIQAAADDLLTQWRDHLSAQPEAKADDTAAIVNWPARDVTGVLALLRHGLQPLTVIAVRPAGIGAALVRHVHGELDARGIDLTRATINLRASKCPTSAIGGGRSRSGAAGKA